MGYILFKPDILWDIKCGGDVVSFLSDKTLGKISCVDFEQISHLINFFVV